MGIVTDKLQVLELYFHTMTVLGLAYLAFTFFGTVAFGNITNVSNMVFGLMSSLFGVKIFGNYYVFPKFVWYFGFSLGGGITLRVIQEVIRVSNEGFKFYKKQRMTDGEKYLEKHKIDRN